MTDEPTTPERGAGDDLPGMPVPPPLETPPEPMTDKAKGPSRAWIWVGGAVVAALGRGRFVGHRIPSG